MAIAPHTMADLEAHERRYGHPSSPLPLVIREAYAVAGLAIPDPRPMLQIIAPPVPGNRSGEGGCCFDTPQPHPSHCHVCGVATAADAHRAAAAVAGFEDAKHLDTGDKIRLLVTHCDEHSPTRNRRHAACSRTETTPGSGHTNTPGGYCEPLSTVETMGVEILPGARQAGRFLKFALTSLGIIVPAWLLSQMAVITSQGQQTADFGGPLANLLIPGDATSGHGFNVGKLRVYDNTGGIPATANASEASTVLGISWVMPATAFSATGTLPATATAGAISNVNASASITAAYARLVENADTFGLSTTLRRYQFAVGTSGSDMNFNTLTIVNAGACSVTSFIFTHGA